MTVGTNSSPGAADAAEERFRDAPAAPAAAVDGLCGVPPQAVDSGRARGARPPVRTGRAAGEGPAGGLG
ncbi:hypothetical protein ACFWHN_37050, partial [Streptomyces yangpuensis]